MFAAGLSSTTKGVDASDKDSCNDGVSIARKVADKYGCICAITGAVDIISDGERVAAISNGHKMLSRVTGTGCMTTALVASFAAASDDLFISAAGGVASMGIAGEIAYQESGKAGTGSFHISIIDALSNLDKDLFLKKAKIDEK